MKNLVCILFYFLLYTVVCPAQNIEKMDVWVENLSLKAERIAERVGRQAERSANELAFLAEDVASDIEASFADSDFKISLGNRRIFTQKTTRPAGYLGIHSDHISREKATRLGFKNKHGSYVSKVVKNSSADQAGLQLFDYIYGVEEQRTSNNQNLTDILDDYEPGELVTIHFIRSGEEKTAEVILGNYHDFSWNEEDDQPAMLGVRPSINERKKDLDGVSIEVVPQSAAIEMGLENNDIIKAVNGYPVLDWDDVSTIIQNLRPGDEVNVQVLRGEIELTKTGRLQERSTSTALVAFAPATDPVIVEGEDLLGESKGAFLGIYIEDISEKKARALGFDNPYGSYVSGVIKNTAAHKAGIEPLDYIFGVDEYRVGAEQSLGGILRKYEPGDEAQVHLFRKGKKISKSVVFRSYSTAEKVRKNKCEDPFFGIIELDKRSGQEGVRVTTVSNSTAREMGLKEGDVILYINGYQMYDWTDIGIAINMLTPGDKITVDFLRGEKRNKESALIKSYAETKNCSNCDCGEKSFSLDGFSPDINISFTTKDDRNKSGQDLRVRIDEAGVALQEVSSNEAKNMTTKGFDMKIVNDLPVTDLRLSPNSNIGMFEMQFDLATKGPTVVQVVNSVGRRIYEYDLGQFSGDFSDYIDISQNGPGTYFLKISQNDKSFVRKIVLTND